MSIEKGTFENASSTVNLDGPRPAHLDERDELLAMVNDVFRVSVGRAPTIASDWPHVYAPQNLANVLVVTDRAAGAAGKIVASTGVWASDVVIGDVRLRVGGINCVGTLPDYRRHGLGSLVMAAAQQRMRDLGCQVGLLGTGIMNWYRRMGWEDGGMQRAYRLNRGNIGLLPPLRAELKSHSVPLNQEESAPADDLLGRLVQLHHDQRMGALRDVARFRQLLTARRIERIVWAESKTEGAGVPLAYVLLHEHEVVEWAGAAGDVAGLVRATFEALDDPTASTSRRIPDTPTTTLAGSANREPRPLRTLLLDTPGWQHPLVNLLDAARIPYESDYVGMLYVVEPQAILDAYGLAEVRVETAEEVAGESGNVRFRLTAGEDHITLDRRQLTKLFFGPERISDVAAKHFPLPFWQWGLERV
jgi:predicted acetyltransferase